MSGNTHALALAVTLAGCLSSKTKPGQAYSKLPQDLKDQLKTLKSEEAVPPWHNCIRATAVPSRERPLVFKMD